MIAFDKLPVLNNARMLLDEAIKRNEPSFLGAAIDKVADLYQVPPHVVGFLVDAFAAKLRMYNKEDASVELFAASQWLAALQAANTANTPKVTP